MGPADLRSVPFSEVRRRHHARKPVPTLPSALYKPDSSNNDGWDGQDAESLGITRWCGPVELASWPDWEVVLGSKVPLWGVLLCALIWVLITIGFGWYVERGSRGEDGLLDQLALDIATFPQDVNLVLTELTDQVSSEPVDRNHRVPAWSPNDPSRLLPVSGNGLVDLNGLQMFADRDALARGWRLLAGVFSIDGAVENAALLLAPDLTLAKVWILDERPAGGGDSRPSAIRFVHGIELLKDGSVIFAFDHGESLQRFDACGERLWTTTGGFDHSVNLDETESHVWAIRDEHVFSQVLVEDGHVIREITPMEIIEANPEIDILEVRRAHPNDVTGNSRAWRGKWLHDRFHFNDVSSLPSAVADAFEQFQAGDLVVSARSLNLIFVFDPETLVIKWWRSGATQRQHDPDWLSDGRISIYNNRMTRGYSEIMTIDPITFETEVLLDGRDYDFYSRIRGKQQKIPRGDLVVSSPQQGRAFEVDSGGNLVLEIVNRRPADSASNYALSELKWYPPDAFKASDFDC